MPSTLIGTGGVSPVAASPACPFQNLPQQETSLVGVEHAGMMKRGRQIYSIVNAYYFHLLGCEQIALAVA